MVPISHEQLATLEHWFTPDRPGPLVGLHVIRTGNGTCLVDRWPEPRALLVETAANYSVAGDPEALAPADLRGRLRGFVEAPPPFVPLLRAAFPRLLVWDRVVLALDGPLRPAPAPRQLVRRLGAGDAAALAALSEGSSWVSRTWGGPAGLASSGTAWGAFSLDRLVSVAGVFFVGDHYEEIGVATEPGFRGRGLSSACAGAVCADILRRGHTPSWTTSQDNAASVRVAHKLGFALRRHDHLYVIS
ncbi:MAG TPA: GNAT family N-acetyltransferase [Actinomycetes bacterium]|jgi:RimJ/RimL family protein N-acetyltransferase|nr:GNAT family N-acetyltransferase [Actinomycetes bacterium]